METPTQPSLLIVDDDPSIRHLLKAVCGAKGITTVAVEGAAATMEVLQERTFDLILLDLQLLDANGFDLAERIKREMPHHKIPIIAMSGHFSTAADVARGFELGFIDYMLKPFTPVDLMARIQSRLNVQESQRKIDEQHQAEKSRALRQIESEQRRFRALACNGFDLIIEFDQGGDPIYLSPNHRAVLGWPESGAPHLIFFSKVHPEDLFRLRATIQTEGDEIISFRLLDGQDTYRQFEASQCRFEFEGGVRSLLICRDMTQQHENQRRLKFLAMHDPLTGLLNRNALEEVFQRHVQKVKRGIPSAIVFADLDRFKVLNDQLGHHAGDEVLQQVTAIMELCTGPDDDVIRYAGDEFLIFYGNTPPEQIHVRAEQIISQVRGYRYTKGEKQFALNISSGGVPLDPDKRLEELLSQADNACYSSKRVGGNRFELFDPGRNVFSLLKSDHDRLEILMDHLHSGKAEVWYQPIVDLESRRPLYYEALLRLRDREGNMISPGDLIAAAERLRAAGDLDLQVLGMSFGDMRKYPWLHPSINLSGQTLANPSFEEWLTKLVDSMEVDPHRIRFEITETCLIERPDEVKERLKRLCDRGFRFLLDDFGSGYSSLSYLREMPIDTLKIDRSFIEKVNDSEFDQTLLQFALRISKTAGLKTVAEGVSQENQREKLLEMGFTQAQGYLFGKAESPEMINQWMSLG